MADVLRKVVRQVKGSPDQGRSGIKFVRILDRTTAEEFDPFLVLDSFDSFDPKDYLPGFPMHPHRGIETLTYLAQGAITHEDHIGSKETIHDGEAQWLTAGSGAFHSEMPQASERMLGAQLWLNIPNRFKLTAEPFYHEISNARIQEFPLDKGKLRLITGNYNGHSAYQPKYSPLDYYDIRLDANSSLELDVPGDNKTVVLFTLLGSADICGTVVSEKTAAKLGEGDKIVIKTGDEPAELLYMCSERMNEPIFWKGLIVMGTQEDLDQAFEDLENGTFVKQEAKYDD